MTTLREFTHLLREVAPHLGTDDTLPMLCGIHLESDGRYLYAAATDRYTIAVARRPLADDGTPEPWTAFLTTADLKAVHAITPPRSNGTATLHLDNTHLNVRIGEHTLTLPDRTKEAASFPKWRPLLADALACEPHLTDDLRLQPSFLARWSKSAATGERWTPLTIWASAPDKPVVLARGEDFIGLLMPVRYDRPAPAGRQAIRTAWAETLHVPAPERSAA